MSKSVTRHCGYQIYPKRYFTEEASPTWRQWNKLTAADVHALREERGFEGQNIFFHLNHPIQFVRLIGLVVDIDVTRAGGHILLTLDDSSGVCIEVKTSFRQIKPDDQAVYPSNTLIDNLDVHVTLGAFKISIDKQPIDIGTVIKAKGTIDTFRKTRQLKLERIWIVKDTNAEAKAWAETAAWKRDVLSKPWVLTDQQRREIDEKIQQDELKEREKAKKRRKWDAKAAEKRKAHDERVEAKRRRMEERLDAGALVGSHLLPI